MGIKIELNDEMKAAQEQYNKLIDLYRQWASSSDPNLQQYAREVAAKLQEFTDHGYDWTNLKIEDSPGLFNKALTALQGPMADYQQRIQAEQQRIEAEGQKQVQARESQIAEREATAKQAQASARSQGVNRGLAASLGNAPLSGYSADNYQNNYANLANLGQSTQNDWLQKMGYVKGLEQTANNMEKGAGLTNLAAWMGGAAGGASSGLSIAGGR